jgi:hypothetical protein
MSPTHVMLTVAGAAFAAGEDWRTTGTTRFVDAADGLAGALGRVAIKAQAPSAATRTMTPTVTST